MARFPYLRYTLMARFATLREIGLPLCDVRSDVSFYGLVGCSGEFVLRLCEVGL